MLFAANGPIPVGPVSSWYCSPAARDWLVPHRIASECTTRNVFNDIAVVACRRARERERERPDAWHSALVPLRTANRWPSSVQSVKRISVILRALDGLLFCLMVDTKQKSEK